MLTLKQTNNQKLIEKKKLKSNVRQFEIDFFGSPLCAKLVRQPSEIRSTYLVSQAVQSPPTELSNSASSVPIGGGYLASWQTQKKIWKKT